MLLPLMLWESLKRIFVHNNNGSLGAGSLPLGKASTTSNHLLYSAKFQQSYSVTPYRDDQSRKPNVRFELTTYALQKRCSTTELIRRCRALLPYEFECSIIGTPYLRMVFLV